MDIKPGPPHKRREGEGGRKDELKGETGNEMALHLMAKAGLGPNKLRGKGR